MGRLGSDVRRPHHQGQAALLPLLREEQGRAQLGPLAGSSPRRPSAPGDFSGPASPAARRPFPNDPLTGQPFPGNKIPANRLSPAGVAFVNLYQLPNNTPSSGCNNYTQAVPAPVNWDQIHARVDWSVTNSTRLMVRYTQDSWKADNTILWGDSADLDGRLQLGPAGQVAGGPAEPEHRVEHDEHPDLLLLGQQRSPPPGPGTPPWWTRSTA